MRTALPALLAGAALVSVAGAAARAALAPAILEVRVVSRGPADEVAADSPRHARLGEPVRLHAVARIRDAKGKVRWVGPGDLAAARVRGKKASVGPWDPALGTPLVRWWKVEPEMAHGAGAARIPGFSGYCNAVLGGADHGKWIGMDRIAYREAAWSPGRAATAGSLGAGAGALAVPDSEPAWSVFADARATAPGGDDHGGLGTMRFKAAVSRDGGATWVASPGAEATDRHGILPIVPRVSVREDDDLAGWLTALFNVPEVFGSVEAQAERFVGADCADVIVASIRARGHRAVGYTYVAGLWKYARPVAAELFVSRDGRLGPTAEDESARPLRWGVDVHRGDVVPIRYDMDPRAYGGRSWPHVGVLYRDASDPDGPARGAPDGVLDGHDLLLHMGHPELTIEPLRSQAPATITVLRWLPKYVGARAATPRP